MLSLAQKLLEVALAVGLVVEFVIVIDLAAVAVKAMRRKIK